MIKKFLGAAFGAGLILSTAVPAFAATINCKNGTTGYRSWNICVQADAKIAPVTLTNVATVTNPTFNGINTGGNRADRNTTSVGGVQSGGAMLGTLNSTNVNTAAVSLNQGGTGNTFNVSNDTTGGRSVNIAVAADVKYASVNVTNVATVTNSTMNIVNTGNNSASRNTVGGLVTSGDVIIDTTNVTTANTNTVTITQ